MDVTGTRRSRPKFTREAATRLWLHRQGFDRPRGATSLGAAAFVDHLELSSDI